MQNFMSCHNWLYFLFVAFVLTTCLFQLVYFVISMFIDNPLTSIQVFDYVLNGTLNGLGLVLLIETK